jgi:RNase adaptor protein for sRNA GlmZ degradation
VQAFIKDDPQTRRLMTLARMVLKPNGRIAFGCFGGRHRSVAIAEMLAGELRREGWTVELQHQQLAVQETAQA